MTNFEQPKSTGLLRSLLLLVLILFGFWVLNDQGLVAIVLEGDKSHISKAILSLWVIVSIYWIYISRNIYLEKSILANIPKSKKNLSINKYIHSLKQGEDKELLLRILKQSMQKPKLWMDGCRHIFKIRFIRDSDWFYFNVATYLRA